MKKLVKLSSISFMFMMAGCDNSPSISSPSPFAFAPTSFNGGKVAIVSEPELFMKHETGSKIGSEYSHPEQPNRVKAIDDMLKSEGLLREENTLKPRQATSAELSLVHDDAYQKELFRQINNSSSSIPFDNRTWKVPRAPAIFS